MRRYLLMILTAAAIFATACSSLADNRSVSEPRGEQSSTAITVVSDNTSADTPASTDNNQSPEPPNDKEDNLNIEIIIGEKTFSATLYDNETARAFKNRLPLTLDMSELNGNEKFYYLAEDLPTNSSKPSKIRTGDIMLYGSNCLVIFYKNFSTSYSYTPIGRIDDPSGLAAALGANGVSVTLN